MPTQRWAKLTDAYHRDIWSVWTVHPAARGSSKWFPVVERVTAQKNGPGWPNTASTRSPRACRCRSWGVAGELVTRRSSQFFAAVPPGAGLLVAHHRPTPVAKQYRQLFLGQPVPETIDAATALERKSICSQCPHDESDDDDRQFDTADGQTPLVQAVDEPVDRRLATLRACLPGDATSSARAEK